LKNFKEDVAGERENYNEQEKIVEEPKELEQDNKNKDYNTYLNKKLSITEEQKKFENDLKSLKKELGTEEVKEKLNENTIEFQDGEMVVRTYKQVIKENSQNSLADPSNKNSFRISVNSFLPTDQD